MSRFTRQFSYIFIALITLATHYLHTRFINDLKDPIKYSQTVSSGKPLVIKFFADWCIACKTIGDSFKELSSEPEFVNVDFIEIDVDKQPDLALKENIRAIPTFIYIFNGQRVGRTIGIKNEQTYKNDIRAEIKSQLFEQTQEARKTENDTIKQKEQQQSLIKKTTIEKTASNQETGFNQEKNCNQKSINTHISTQIKLEKANADAKKENFFARIYNFLCTSYFYFLKKIIGLFVP